MRKIRRKARDERRDRKNVDEREYTNERKRNKEIERKRNTWRNKSRISFSIVELGHICWNTDYNIFYRKSNKNIVVYINIINTNQTTYYQH